MIALSMWLKEDIVLVVLGAIIFGGLRLLWGKISPPEPPEPPEDLDP